MEVPVELARIVINTSGGDQKIFLREKGGQRRAFPIGIGLSEALAIDRRLKGVDFHRPLTHELLASTIEALGGRVEKIVITELRYDVGDGWGTFIATLYVHQGDRVIPIDARPSDAIALGAGLGTPIYVAEEVLQAVTTGPDDPKERIALLQRRMKQLTAVIRKLSAQLEDTEFLATASPETLQEQRQHLELLKQEYEAIDRLLRELS